MRRNRNDSLPISNDVSAVRDPVHQPLQRRALGITAQHGLNRRGFGHAGRFVAAIREVGSGALQRPKREELLRSSGLGNTETNPSADVDGHDATPGSLITTTLKCGGDMFKVSRNFGCYI